MTTVEIKAIHTVHPAKPTWTGTTALTELDAAFASVFIPYLYLYRGTDCACSSTAGAVDALKASLSEALVEFYPFAGRLRAAGGGRVSLERGEETPGVSVVEAVAAVEMAELGDLAAAEEGTRLRELFAAVDYRKPLHELPLMAVRVTEFRCGGVAVGITVSHAVADGFGIGHFFSEWTRLARGEPLELKPAHDRSLLRAGEPPRSAPPTIVELTPAPPSPKSGDGPTPLFMETATLKVAVSQSQIDKLKQIAGVTDGSRPYSRFEILTAHTWRCASKARGRDGDKPNVLAITIDIRKRMCPPLPTTYHGNATVTLPCTSMSSNDLNSNSLRGACNSVRQTINSATDEYVLTYLDHLKSQNDLRVWRGNMTPQGRFVKPDLVMVSWLTLPIYGLDFGWGKEAHMASSPPVFEGVSCLLAGRREEESATVVICLQVTHAEKFKKYFYEVLN